MLKDTFLIKTKYKSIINKLSDKQAGVLFKMIFEYVENGANTGSTDDKIDMAFEFIKMDLDSFSEKYQKRVEANRVNGKLGAKFGKLGGRPKKEKPPKTPNGDIKTPKTPDNDSDNDISTDVDIKEKNTKKKKFNFKKSLLDYGFEESWVGEWMKVRKSKGAVNSEKAFENFIREVEKVKMDKNELLEFIAVKKQWRGFEAKWIENENNKTHAENRGSSQVTDEQLAESIRRGIARGVAENAR